ncbi:hypothetical protein SGFS_071370 [Streptomyces graminofaciens]|uniref:Uncharacterized protein n=1 Tax=Streptomyces graminofaciens TaxID=68212 RepID=A0ABN5VQT3_9ACTN|nr:hypothetical protein SGFS_071370 [Streptomyces graminofaciens]
MKVPSAPRRLARHLAALSGSSAYAQYADDPPPCDAPPRTRRRGPRPPGERRYFRNTPWFGRCPTRARNAGGFGATWPFTLAWHDAHVARECLGLTPLIGPRPETFEELRAFLAESRIQVHLD